MLLLLLLKGIVVLLCNNISSIILLILNVNYDLVMVLFSIFICHQYSRDTLRDFPPSPLLDSIFDHILHVVIVLTIRYYLMNGLYNCFVVLVLNFNLFVMFLHIIMGVFIYIDALQYTFSVKNMRNSIITFIMSI